MEDIYKAFEILGISYTTDMSVVSKAFRVLAKRYHPDSNPQKSAENQKKMQMINEAYSLIKKYLKSGEFSGSIREPTGRTHDVKEEWVHYRSRWEKAWEEARKKREEKIRMEMEKRRREEEFLRRFWEKVAKMKKVEDEDEKKFEVILNYVLVLIKFYYKNNLHNVSIRSRPYNIAVFDGYVKKFREIIKRVEFEGSKLGSERFSEKARIIVKFLNVFLNTVMFPAPQSIERVASAYESYSRLVESTDRIMMDFFNSENPVFISAKGGKRSSDNQKEVMAKYKDRIKKALDTIESFLTGYPSSPLVDYARGRVEMLESFYYAFF